MAPPRSKPWSQFPHDPNLGGQSKQCLDYMLTQLNQLLGQANVPPASSAYSFGPDIINPTTAQFISLGGRPSSVTTAITYNAAGTSITFYWDGTNSSQELTIYRDDDTVVGPTIVGSPFLVTGLVAATRYFFYPYWDDINKLVRFVTIPNVSVGSPPVAFPAYNIKAQQIQILREHIPLASIVGTSGIVAGSGPGSAGGGGGGGRSGATPGPTASAPGGVNGDIQFNNAGVFGGEALLPLAHGGTDADLSLTGGTSQFLMQSSAGANVTVGQPSASDLTNGTVGAGAVVLASALPATINFADEETPGGTINSANLIFTLAHSPNPAISLTLFYNGLLQKPSGADYTLVGSTITFVSPPTTGSTLLAWYRF